MMRKKLLTLLSFALLGATASFAQKGVEDGSRFGHGEDSLRCLQNISMYREAVKINDFASAYTPWKAVFTEAPLAQMRTYIDGVQILRSFLEKEQDATKRAAYFNELMGVYDQRLKYLDKLNGLVRNPVTPASIKAAKAHDFYVYSGANVDLKTAYAMFKELYDESPAEADDFIYIDYMDVSSKLYQANEAHRDAFIADYLKLTEQANANYDNATEDERKEQWEKIKLAVEGYFIKSGAASCENLQKIYGPQIEANKNNMDFLKQVMGIMELLDCTDQEAYFNAGAYAHAIAPTAQSAKTMASRALKAGDSNKAIEYFDQAIKLESDANKKADIAYSIAVLLVKKKSYSSARQYARTALNYSPNYGKAYILIAQMYAASPNWSDDPTKNKCTYYAAIDKLIQARNVDPRVASQANRLIGQYFQYTPKDEDLFFQGIRKGTPITIGGWIGENTTIR